MDEPHHLQQIEEGEISDMLPKEPGEISEASAELAQLEAMIDKRRNVYTEVFWELHKVWVCNQITARCRDKTYRFFEISVKIGRSTLKIFNFASPGKQIDNNIYNQNGDWLHFDKNKSIESTWKGWWFCRSLAWGCTSVVFLMKIFKKKTFQRCFFFNFGAKRRIFFWNFDLFFEKSAAKRPNVFFFDLFFEFQLKALIIFLKKYIIFWRSRML